jgi:hypothetical protein
MSIFGNILTKLGLKKPEPGSASTTSGQVAAKPSISTPAAPSKGPEPAKSPVQTNQPHPAASASKSVQTGQPLRSAHPAQDAAPAVPTPAVKPTPMAMVDVMSKLETMAKGTNLDWRVSIVDLLKVLEIDSSLAARKELATELGAQPEVMQDNVKMNVWLHKTVLAKIAENGGNIPKELLD